MCPRGKQSSSCNASGIDGIRIRQPRRCGTVLLSITSSAKSSTLSDGDLALLRLVVDVVDTNDVPALAGLGRGVIARAPAGGVGLFWSGLQLFAQDFLMYSSGSHDESPLVVCGVDSRALTAPQ